MDENMNLTPEINDEPENAPEIVTPAEPETLDSSEIEVVSEAEAVSEPEPVDPPEIEVVSEPAIVPEPEIVPAQPEPVVSVPQNTSGGNIGAANQTTPPPQNVTYVQNIIQKTEEGSTVLAVVSLVLGILGILISCCLGGLCLLFSIPATICSIISIVKKQGGRGMAIAGLIMGIIGDLIGIVLLLILLGMFGSMMSLSEM